MLKTITLALVLLLDDRGGDADHRLATRSRRWPQIDHQGRDGARIDVDGNLAFARPLDDPLGAPHPYLCCGGVVRIHTEWHAGRGDAHAADLRHAPYQAERPFDNRPRAEPGCAVGPFQASSDGAR